VIGVAVGFDHEPLGTPEEIDLERLGLEHEPGVDLGPRQRGALAEDQERLLEVGSSHGRADLVLAQRRPQPSAAGDGPEPAQQLVHGAEIEETQHFGLVAGPLEGATVDDASQVEESAGHRGAGDSLVDGGVGSADADRSVKLDAWPAPAALGR
jgi:hypothetical protein